MSAAEDDEVVGVMDDVRAEGLAASRKTPMLQEAVHLNHGEQWAVDPALRRAAHAPCPVAVPFLDRCFQPQFDQLQHMPARMIPLLVFPEHEK
jgi:hypothetical protein